MRDPHQTIKRPLLTEKSDRLRERSGQYCFEVAVEADKSDVKRAVETLFSVRVTAVRLQNRQGKAKRMGRFTGRRHHWKKAFVTLAEGSVIELYEGI